MDNREDRIRAKAQALWEEAGRPEGRADEHWMKAARLIDADQHKDEAKSDKRGPGIDIAPATEGNSLGDIRGPGPKGL